MPGGSRDTSVEKLGDMINNLDIQSRISDPILLEFDKIVPNTAKH